MSAPSPDVAHHRSRVAGLQRYGDPDPEKLAQAREDLRRATLLDRVARLLADAPPLSPEQIGTIVGMLRTGGA